jgi:ElaB/YqjD/DUF883 family membrane-anchored ribosome-binding protein
MVSVSSVKDKADDTREQLAQLRAQVESLMSERVTPALADAADRAQTTYRAASDSLHDNAERLSTQVRDRPLIAILVAAAAGYLVGKLFH